MAGRRSVERRYRGLPRSMTLEHQTRRFGCEPDRLCRYYDRQAACAHSPRRMAYYGVTNRAKLRSPKWLRAWYNATHAFSTAAYDLVPPVIVNILDGPLWCANSMDCVRQIPSQECDRRNAGSRT